MGSEGNRLLFVILAGLLLLAPLGQGGATPLALFVTQTLVAAAGMIALVVFPRRPKLDGAARGVFRAATGFVAIALLSCWGSPYPYASFLRCLDFAILWGVLALATTLPWTEREKSLLADCLLCAATLQAALVLIGRVRGTTASMIENFGLLNTNHEAAYLLAAALLTLPRCFVHDQPRFRLVRGLAASLCMLAFILLTSRGAFLGLLVGAAVLLTGRWKGLMPRARLRAGVAMGIVLALSLMLLVSRFQFSEDPYRFERARIWEADLRCFAGHPLLGVGPGIFRHIVQRYNFPLDAPVRFGRKFETPHSDYLGVMVEVGLVGLGMGLFLLFRSLKFLAGTLRGRDPISQGMLAASAALAAHGLVEDLSTRPGLMVTVALLLGARLAGSRKQVPMRRFGPTLSLSSALMGLALALAWWVAVLNPYRAFERDRSMRRSVTYREMDRNYRLAIGLNPYQAHTYLFPAVAFLSTRPEATLSPDLYARFRKELDEGDGMNRVSPDLRVALGRMEVRAFRALFHDAPTRDRALVAYRTAIRLAPHDPRIRVELAGFLREVGRGGEAGNQVRLAVQEEPEYLTAHYLETHLLLDRGSREEALSSWKMAEKIRASLATYRPDSGYASDITRDPVSLRESLELELRPP